MRKFKIDSVNKTVIFTFPFDKEISKEVKNCGFTSRWNPELEHWVVGVTEWSILKIKEIIRGYGFTQEIDKPRPTISYDYSVSEKRMDELSQMCEKLDFEYQPRKYQLEALHFALKVGNIINGDDVGLGKTFESIMYAEVIDAFPCLVVVPSSVKEQWSEKWLEIRKGKTEVSVITGNQKKNNWNAEVVVINYDMIGKKQGKGATVKFPELKEIDWEMVIFDEAHFLKTSTSNRAKAAKMIVKHKPIVQLLSGTITMNRPIELWNLLELSNNSSKIVKHWMQFVQRYCGGYKGKWGFVSDGATNIFELNERLRNTCYMRREKSDVLKELPKEIKQIIYVPINNKKAIDFATNDFIEYIIETKGQEAGDKAAEAEQLVQLGVLRMLSIDGKLKAIEQYLKDWAEGDTRLVVFGVHRSQLDYLSEKFKSPFLSHAKNSKHKRQMIKDWCSGNDQFLFANILSAGTGIDGLQDVCSNMVVIEMPWRPSDITQIIGRLHRSGQKLVTSVTFLLSRETIDVQMLEMIQEKERITEAINKGLDIIKMKSGMKFVIERILKLKK